MYRRIAYSGKKLGIFAYDDPIRQRTMDGKKRKHEISSMFNVGGKDQHESELHTQSMFIFIHLLLVEATDGMQHWHRTSEEL